MEQQLSDSAKATLIKIALELKKMGWKSNSHTSEIDIFQGHIGMHKDSIWNGNNELPDVQVDVFIDMSFERNEQNDVYFLVFNESYSLFVEGAGSSEKQKRSDMSIDFVFKADANNIAKIRLAAKELNDHVNSNIDEYGYEYSQESYNAWKQYNASGTAYADRTEPWKDDNY